MLKKSLIALAFGSFAIGMTEFTMMGILQDIANDLHIDIPSAGHLIAIYALGVVVGAPTLVLLTSKYPPKNVLLFLMGLFVLFNGLFAAMPEYTTMMITRFMSGLPHGAFFGVASVVATRLADKGKEAQAISIMFTGMTLANLFGVPLGTYIGHHVSWRWTYALISMCGLATIAAVLLWLPKIAIDRSANMFKQLKYFTTKEAWVLIGMISIGTGGMFAWMTYISPLMTNVAGLEESNVTYIMALVGLGMVIGNLLGGRLSDKIGSVHASIVCFTAMALCLLLVYTTIHIDGLAYGLAFITGLISFTVGSPLQVSLINSAKGAETLAASAGQAAFNLGNTLGAFLGGMPLVYGFAYNSPLLVGIGMASIGALIAFYYLMMMRSRNTPTSDLVPEQVPETCS